MRSPKDDPHGAGVAETMADAIEDLVARVTAAAAVYDDPVDQADALELALAQVPALQEKIGRARSQAVARALETRSAAAVADQMGLTRQRIYQLVRGVDVGTL